MASLYIKTYRPAVKIPEFTVPICFFIIFNKTNLKKILAVGDNAFIPCVCQTVYKQEIFRD